MNLSEILWQCLQRTFTNHHYVVVFYAVWSLNGEVNYLMCNLAACVNIKIVTTNKPITLDLILWLKLLSIM